MNPLQIPDPFCELDEAAPGLVVGTEGEDLLELVDDDHQLGPVGLLGQLGRVVLHGMRAGREHDGAVAGLGKSVGGSLGGSVGRALVRGALGGLLRR